MSDGQVKLKYTGDPAEAIKAIAAIQKELSKAEKENVKLAKTSAKGAKDNARISADTKKVIESVTTAQEKHNRRVAELNKLRERGSISQGKYTRAVSESKREMDAAGKSGKAAFGAGAVAMVGGMATAITGGVLAAWKLVKDEVDAVAAAQRRAGQATMPLANAQAGALRNLGATTPEERDEFVADVEAMADRTGVTERQIYQLASPAFSAKGHLSSKQAMQSVEVGAKVAPDDVSVGEAFSGATLDLSKIAGTSAEEGAGYLMSVGQKARVTDPGKMARSIGPALTAATSHEASLQTGGAMYAALTGSMVDETGEKTKTAVIKLADSLDEFLPKISTAHERIKALQQDTGLQEKFLDKYSFEVDAKEPIKQLVTGRGPTAEAYGKFQAELPDPKAAGEFYQQWLQTFQGGSLQVTAAMGRATDQLKEGLRTADQGAARIGLVTEELKTTLQDAGMSALGSRLETFGAKIQGNELSQVLGILDRERERLASTHVEMTGDGPVEVMPTPAELGKSSVLSQFTAQIRAALDRETQDRAAVRESRAAPAPAPGSKLPSRADWISGKVSWEEATGLPPMEPVDVPVRNVEFPPQPSAERVRIGVNRQFPDVASPPTLPYPKVDGPTTIPAPPAFDSQPAQMSRGAATQERAAQVPAMSTTSLETKTDRQTEAVKAGNEALIDEIRGLRSDLQHVPRTPQSPPRPDSSSVANMTHS